MLFNNNVIDNIIIGIYNKHFDIIDCITRCFIIINLKDGRVFIATYFIILCIILIINILIIYTHIQISIHVNTYQYK